MAGQQSTSAGQQHDLFANAGHIPGKTRGGENCSAWEPALNSGLASVVQFAGSLPGSILLSLGQTIVVVCACSDMVRLLSVPGSHGRYVANTVFRTLAPPAILVTALRVLIDAASGIWPNVTAGMFVLVVLTYRWRTDTDEDNWWKGKGKALGRWLRKQTAIGFRPAPAAARSGSTARQSLNRPAKSSAVSEPPESASPSMTSAKSCDFFALSAMTFSSIVSLATSR